MKIANVFFILIYGVLLSIACQTNPSSPNNAANKTADKPITNANQNNNQANKTEVNTAGNDAKTETNSMVSPIASTPAAAYKSAYAARKNKDIKTLKQLISKDMFEFFEMLGEGKQNALDEGLKDFVETPQNPSDETRNEKIKGDTATLEYLDAKGDWQTMDFVKEEGVWKLTIAKMDLPEGKNNDKKSK